MNTLQILQLTYQYLPVILGAIHIISLFIVNLSNTPPKTGVTGKAYKGIEIMAGIISPKAKQHAPVVVSTPTVLEEKPNQPAPAMPVDKPMANINQITQSDDFKRIEQGE